MSFHHGMMLQRYGLGSPTDIYSQVYGDPVFTPIFTAVFSSSLFGFSSATVAALAGAATAIAAGGGYQEFKL